MCPRPGTAPDAAWANAAALDRLRRAGLLDPDGPVRVHPTINSAVAAYRASTRDR